MSIEEYIIQYFNDTPGFPKLYAEVPDNMTDGHYYLIEKTSSSTENHVITSKFALQSISTNSLLESIRMNEEIKLFMEQFVAAPRVARVELDSDYNFTDPDRNEYRYQAVFNITHY